MMYLTNAFSLQMLPEDRPGTGEHKITYKEIDTYGIELFVRKGFDAGILMSAVGHEDTAAVIAASVGVPTEKIFNRKNIKLTYGDQVVVCQLIGGRLPEGTKTLPEGFSFKWFILQVLE